MAARLLLTGFEPFGSHPVNPSREILGPLRSAPPPGLEIVTRVLPVRYRDAFEPIRRALAVERFDAVLLMGLAARAAAIRVERVARNLRGGELADNEGVVLSEVPVAPDGPAACLATAEVERLAAAMRRVDVPAEVSTDAGAFLCNQVLYQTLLHARRARLDLPVTFLHLPQATEHAPSDEPSLPFDTLVRGVTAAAACLTEPPAAPRV